MNTIDVQNLGMNFGRFPALSNFSLTVPTGTATNVEVIKIAYQINASMGAV